MNHKPVRKAVIAAAGFGTRFLPQTKAMPKEMLPLVDKPIIQYIVEQLCEAGITDIVIVTGYHKRTIEDHFDHTSADLRANLKGSGKLDLLEETKKISNLANFAYVRQKGPYGTATPLLNASHLLGDEPFIFTYADDITMSSPNCFSQMIELYNEFNTCILPCIKITEDIDYGRYGIVAGNELRDGVMSVERIIEKPGRAAAPSNMASVGGYLLTPDVLRYVESGLPKVEPGKEFHATDNVLQPMLADGHVMHACEITNGTRYDTGNPLDYLKTVFDFALQREDIGPELKAHLRNKLQ